MDHHIKINWTQESNFEYEENNQKPFSSPLGKKVLKGFYKDHLSVDAVLDKILEVGLENLHEMELDYMNSL